MAEEQEKSIRQKQLETRRKLITDSMPKIERVRVVAANEALAKVLKHPSGGRKFPEGGGSVEWPLDNFTKRRLADGSVTREAPEESAKRARPRHESSAS
jgi:hypothetical protein